MAFYFRVDHKLRLLSVFSPKCASNSINKWMDALAYASALGNDVNRTEASRVSSRQLPKYADYTTVLFLRDPLRRLASFYAQWVVREPDYWCFADDEQRFPLHHKSFRAFLYIMEHLFSHGLTFQHHLKMQTDNLSSFEFQHIILTENLEARIKLVNKQLGYDVDIRNLNQSEKRDEIQKFIGDYQPLWLAENGIPAYKWFYDTEIAEIAEHIYAIDISYYRASGGQILEGLQL